MNDAASPPRTAGFTLVELLLAIALGVLVALIIGALLHGLLATEQAQSLRLRGPLAAQAALRTMTHEISSAFPPPGTNTTALHLQAPSSPGHTQNLLTFYAPAPLDPPIPGAYGMARITYQTRSLNRNHHILERIHTPCSGPATNQLTTNSILAGNFTLVCQALTNGSSLSEWPPPGDSNAPPLPQAIRLTLTQPGKKPLQTTALIQTAHDIPSPRERSAKESNAP